MGIEPHFFFFFFTNKQYSLKPKILPSTTTSCYHGQLVWPPRHPQVSARCRSDCAQRTTQNPKIKPCFWFWRWKRNSHLLFIYPTTTQKGSLTRSTSLRTEWNSWMKGSVFSIVVSHKQWQHEDVSASGNCFCCRPLPLAVRLCCLSPCSTRVVKLTLFS